MLDSELGVEGPVGMDLSAFTKLTLQSAWVYMKNINKDRKSHFVAVSDLKKV